MRSNGSQRVASALAASVPMTLGMTVLATPAVATEQAKERRDARGTKQDGRKEARDIKY